MNLVILNDAEIDRYGELLEMQVGAMIAKCMKDPPHNMNWLPFIKDAPDGSHYSTTAQGTWRQMRKYSAQNGGGSVVVMDPVLWVPVGYAHCKVLTEQGITDFQLDDSSLDMQASPGDLLLTFAGLLPHYRGARVEDGQIVFPPEGGWESGDKKPGVGLYQILYEKRVFQWGEGRRCWNRTHPERGTVRFTGGKFGLKPRGVIEVMQAGIKTPKVILATDGPFHRET